MVVLALLCQVELQPSSRLLHLLPRCHYYSYSCSYLYLGWLQLLRAPITQRRKPLRHSMQLSPEHRREHDDRDHHDQHRNNHEDFDRKKKQHSLWFGHLGLIHG